MMDVPVRLKGTLSGTVLDQPYMSFHLDVPGKRYGTLRREGQLHGINRGSAWLAFSLDRLFYEEIADQQVYVSGGVNIPLFQNVKVLPLPRANAVVVPAVGVCRDALDTQGRIEFRCLSPAPRAAVMVGKSGVRTNWIVTPGALELPVPAVSGFQPLKQYVSMLPYRNWEEIGDAELIVAEPLPLIRLELGSSPITLRNYVVGPRPPARDR
jgi:hypothetical protein